MKIAYVGNFSQPHCTEVHLAATLRDLGHEVISIQEDKHTSDQLANVLTQIEFELFLFTRTWGKTVTLGHLEQLRERKIPSASYHLDLYIGLKREEGLDDDPFWRTDFVFTPDGDPKSAEVFKAKGINHFYMKPGVYKPECYMANEHKFDPGDPTKTIVDLGNDVVFVGTGGTPDHPRQYGHPEWPYRGQLIQWLKDTYGKRFSKYGDPDLTVRNAQLNQLYANSKVVVGDSLCLNFSKPFYWSDRAYETMGRGGFLIHPFITGMDEEFKDGENIVFYKYNNWDDLKHKIDYYLDNQWAREKIRKAGHEFVKNHATYHDRLKQMLDTVFPAGWPAKLGDKLNVDQGYMIKYGNAPIKINLGAGSEPTDGWVNVDWVDQQGIDVVHNLLEFPWPFKDGVADEMLARDVLEHMPLFNSKNESTPIKFIEECWRILQPDGRLFITVPHHESKNLWIDPTHVRGYDEKSFDYFDPDTDLGKWYGYYSDKKFKVSAVRTPNDNVEFTLIKRG